MKPNSNETLLPSSLRREAVAAVIVRRLCAEQDRLRSAWKSASPFAHIVIDDLLPAEVAREFHARLPPPEQLLTRSSLRQRKRVGVELERYDPAVSELLFAFQHHEVVQWIEQITGLVELAPDASLYASGLSVIAEGGFLNPHLDNSHDGEQSKYRALNLLYYLSPGWLPDHGGNLELWDKSVRHPTAVLSAFNRLVLMKTDRCAWHSVTRVASRQPRWCASNYYFSSRPPADTPYRHVTTFAGRPEEKGKRLLLALDGLAVNVVGKMFPALVRRNKHRRSTDAAHPNSEARRYGCDRSLPDDTSAPNDPEPGR
ncbi:MAG TPA: 2OG-Fe(II) oxygenase [Pirellulales bacterium]|nr:2OG-Fe(II) oxygenase [Pirellulales bacterium]